jgi:hypothetical protein
MIPADRTGGLDALHVVAGWHPDVGDDRVRNQSADGVEQLIGRADGGDDLIRRDGACSGRRRTSQTARRKAGSTVTAIQNR